MQRYFCKVTPALGRNQAAGTRALARALPGSDRQFWSNSDRGEFNDDQDHQTRHRDCTYKSDGSCNFNQALAVSVPGGSVAVKAAAPTASAKVKYRHHTVRHYQNYALGIIDLTTTTPTMGPWGRSITRHRGINCRGNNRRSKRTTRTGARRFVGQCRTLSAASRRLPWSAARGGRSPVAPVTCRATLT